MNVRDAIVNRRSIRRFKQKPVSIDVLQQLVDAARLAPSAANLQPLQYIAVNEPELCAQIFDQLGWAGYLKPSWTPAPEERPMAYIVIMVSRETRFDPIRDIGLAAENIMLCAEEAGLGSCMLMKIQRDILREILSVPPELTIDSVIALGYKDEHPVVEEMTDSIEYWRDDRGTLHVPKRKLADILHVNTYTQK